MTVKEIFKDIKYISKDCGGLATTVMTLGEIISTGNIFTITIKLTQNILFNGFDIFDDIN